MSLYEPLQYGNAIKILGHNLGQLVLWQHKRKTTNWRWAHGTLDVLYQGSTVSVKGQELQPSSIKHSKVQYTSPSCFIYLFIMWLDFLGFTGQFTKWFKFLEQLCKSSPLRQTKKKYMSILIKLKHLHCRRTFKSYQLLWVDLVGCNWFFNTCQETDCFSVWVIDLFYCTVRRKSATLQFTYKRQTTPLITSTSITRIPSPPVLWLLHILVFCIYGTCDCCQVTGHFRFLQTTYLQHLNR